MRDDRDDVLHTAPAIKNIVTIVTVVTENSFLPCLIFGKSGKRTPREAGECRGGAAPLCPSESAVPLIVIGACGDRCQRYYGVTFGTKVKIAQRKEMIV